MTNYGKRGQDLEKMIEQTNENYKRQGKALVQKIATPVKVLNITPGGRINNAFYDKKSTVDYIGVYDGIPLAFDAKETAIDTRFDLKNVKPHQYTYMKSWHENRGVSFLIIYFSTLDEVYYLPFKKLEKYGEYYTNEWSYEGRKSIPYDEIANKKYQIRQRGLFALDYLAVIDKIKEVE